MNFLVPSTGYASVLLTLAMVGTLENRGHAQETTPRTVSIVPGSS